MPKIKTKSLIITIQENQSSIYEYNEGKLLFNSTIDNDTTTSHEEARDNWNTFATGKGKIVSGNEGQWRKEVNKHILKETFVVLQSMYLNDKNIKGFGHILVFFSSNTPKHDLEDQIESFQNNHNQVIIEIEPKNVHDHEAIEKACIKHFSKLSI
jgi:hypothetical protein